MLEFRLADYDTFAQQCEPLRQEHYLEIVAKRGAQYAVMDDFYRACGENLRIIIAYSDDEPVGYHVALVMDDIHDTTRLLAQTDMIYLAPALRKGYNGVQLLRAAEIDLIVFAPEATWRASIPVDAEKDMGVLYERERFSPIERVYEKRLAAEITDG